MPKLKVQEATRELAQGASKLLVDVQRIGRSASETLASLRRMEQVFLQKEEERREAARLEQQRLALEQQSTAWVMPEDDEEEAGAQLESTPSVEAVPTPLPKEEEKAAQPPEAPAEPLVAASQEAPVKVEAPAKPAQAEMPPQVARPIPAQAAPGQDRPQMRPAQPMQPGMRPPMPQQPRPMQPAGNRPPMQPGMQGGPYGRPAPGAQQGPYGRPAPGAQQGGPYGRPAPGAQQGGPYGRPAPGAQGGQFGRPAPGAQGPGMGGGPARPGAPMGARPGMARGPRGPELTPTVEKERVSNYDPNKKLYQRQYDPERKTARKGGGGVRELGITPDDDVMRGGRNKRRKQSIQSTMAPIRIEKAQMTAETITVKDLTERIGKPAGEIIKKLLLLGTMATINQELDYDTASLVCAEFGVELEKKLDKTAEDFLDEANYEDDDADLIERPPVVTIMGHVDHGKTSLLDYIRKSRVTEGEAGGITQHIGAYMIDLDGRPITFLDTPGHEAFTAMRARGAQATDIAVLVVAADDGVMPQTIEAINHAKAAKVPIIVAINKMDKEGVNPDRIKQDLTAYELVAEEWGGDTIMVPVSALTGDNVGTLLEMILLVADVQQLRANPDRRARGIIIEAKLDKGRGPVATVLVQNGTLHVGDTVVAGMAYGRIRAMTNERGERLKEAGPSTPVEVVGFGEVPDAGDDLNAVDDRLSRQVVEERRDKQRAALVKASAKVSLDDLFTKIAEGSIKDLNLIIKGDVQGSVEAVKQSLERLSNDEVRIHTIHSGVGAITENDVQLAAMSGAIIIGFNVRPENNARDMAAREEVDVRLYRVIYQAIEDVEKAMKGMLAPQYREVILGHAQVRNTFRITGVGTVAGCHVTDGKIQRNESVRLLRDNIVVFEGKLDSLKRFKDDAKEVAQGFECGVGLEKYNDVKEGDVIECYTIELIVR